MEDLITLISKYSIVEIIVVILLLYSGIKWLWQQIIEWKNKFNIKKEEYHRIESEKEQNKENIETRFKTIEAKLVNDYERIQKYESHLYQIETTIKELNEIIINIRIQSLRKQILDFTSRAVDLNNCNISRESYAEIDRVYKEYEELLEKSDKENGYVEYSYSCIQHSLYKREQNKLFLEDFYIRQSDSMNKAVKENNINIGIPIDKK